MAMTKLPILTISVAILTQLQCGQGVINPNWTMRRIGVVPRPLLNSPSSSSFSGSIPTQSRTYPNSKTVTKNDPYEIIRRQRAEMAAHVSEALGTDFPEVKNMFNDDFLGSDSTGVTTGSPSARLEALSSNLRDRTNKLISTMHQMGGTGGPGRVTTSVQINDQPPKVESYTISPKPNTPTSPAKPYSSTSPPPAPPQSSSMLYSPSEPAPASTQSPSPYSSESPVSSAAPYSPSSQPATCSASSTKPKRPNRQTSSLQNNTDGTPNKTDSDYGNPNRGSLPPPPPRRFNSFGNGRGNASSTERFQGSTVVSEELPNQSGKIEIRISGREIDDERMLQLIKEAKNAVTAVFYAPLYSAKVEGTISFSQRPQWSIF